jgi:hypothetical protein
LTPKKVLSAAQRKIGFECNFKMAQAAPFPMKILAGIPDIPRLFIPTRHPDDAHRPWKDQGGECLHCPYGASGERLWVRETHRAVRLKSEREIRINYRAGGEDRILNEDSEPWWRYAADLLTGEGQTRGAYLGDWRPSIFMHRCASRITLEITDVRVERLQEISEADAIAEGFAADPIPGTPDWTARRAFRNLWETLNAPRGFGWDVNPWVWVVSFKRVDLASPE